MCGELLGRCRRSGLPGAGARRRSSAARPCVRIGICSRPRRCQPAFPGRLTARTAKGRKRTGPRRPGNGLPLRDSGGRPGSNGDTRAGRPGSVLACRCRQRRRRCSRRGNGPGKSLRSCRHCRWHGSPASTSCRRRSCSTGQRGSGGPGGRWLRQILGNRRLRR